MLVYNDMTHCHVLRGAQVLIFHFLIFTFYLPNYVCTVMIIISV